MNIVELFFFRQIHEKIPGASASHLKALLVLLAQNRHFTLVEITQATHLSANQTQRILHELAKTGLVHQEGCLYRQQRINEIDILA